MIIRNAIIMTPGEDTPLQMNLDELRNFSGNIVFCRSKLPADLAERIDGAVGCSPKQTGH